MSDPSWVLPVQNKHRFLKFSQMAPFLWILAFCGKPSPGRLEGQEQVALAWLLWAGAAQRRWCSALPRGWHAAPGAASLGSACASRWNVPEMARAATTVPISEARQHSWQGPSAFCGEAVRERVVLTVPRLAFHRASAERITATQSRAPFPGLVKPCIVWEGGNSITASHHGLPVTSEPGQHLRGSERAGSEPGLGGCTRTARKARALQRWVG